MDNNNSNPDSSHSNPRTGDTSTTRSGVHKRGIVAMKKVTESRKKGIKIKVQFNVDGQPIGPNKSTYADYICLLGRTYVPLTESDWRFVSPLIKQAIWEDIEQCFEVDDSVMEMTLKKVGKAARAFRHEMATHCFDEEGNPNPNPPERYADFEIVHEHWNEFVRICGQSHFRETSEINSTSAKNMKLRHRIGALGYAQLKENMKDELELLPPAKQRMSVWKKARVGKDGNIVEEEVKRIVDEGESIANSMTTEEMMCRGPNDVLSKAIPKEYHGRVLTAGCGVTKKGYFGKRRETSNDAEIYRLSQALLQMEKAIQELKARDEQRNNSTDKFQGMSERGSCPAFGSNRSLEDDLDQIPEGESMCDLFVEHPLYANVGSGLVFKKEGHKVHNKPLQSNEVQVCLKEVVDGHEMTPLPIPNEIAEVYTVGDAVGTFVVWPLELVSLQKKVIMHQNNNKSAAQSFTPIAKKKSVYPRPGDIDPVACFQFCLFYTKNNNNSDVISVVMPDEFWDSAFTDYVSVENVREVVNLEWLSSTSISIYIRYLCDVYLAHVDDGTQRSNNDQNSSKYSFTSPHVAAGHTHIVDALQRHEGRDHLVIIPVNIDQHWVLVAINTLNENVYYLDPLRICHSHPGRKRLNNMITSAMNSYWATKRNSGLSGRRPRHVQWHDIECPKQDPTSGYCAYYICLFIEDILSSETTNVPAAYFQSRRCKTFADDRINHVKNEWCGYFFNMFLKNV